MFPPLEPFKTGWLRMADGNEIYWEASGNPAGRPALYLHGGPGGGLGAGYRRHFDPDKFLIVSFEQRGCGRSRPRVTDPGADLAGNTTQAIIADIEALREFFDAEGWLIVGVSWGTALGLAYAQAHPDRVSALVLALVHIPEAFEVEWITEHMRHVFPREWAEFEAASGHRPGQRLIDAYYELITHPDKSVREAAALAWCRWENAHISLPPDFDPNTRFADPEYAVIIGILVIHYWKNGAFLGEPGIVANMGRISHIPGVMIHGRLDISAPMSTVWALHQNWPGSRLIILDNEGHGGPRMVEEINKAVAGFLQQANP